MPLLLACLIFEGPSESINQIINITWPAFFAAVYGAIGITLVTVCLWTKLLLRAPASSVLPFTLLMPLFAIIFSKVILEETLTFHQMIAGFIILLGVMMHIWGMYRIHQRNK